MQCLGQGGPGFPVLWLQSAGNGSFVADAEKTKNSLLLFQIKNLAPYLIFSMDPSQTKILTKRLIILSDHK